MDAFELQLDSLCKSYPLPQPPLRFGRCNGATSQLKTKKALAGVSRSEERRVGKECRL